MDLTLALIAAITGYLCGSISFARVITRIVAPGHDISRLVIEVPETDTVIESNAISATAVRMHLGARYGCMVSILDMLKAAVPALVFKLWLPQTPYYLLAAGFAVVGHNWPVFHRFVGGRGLSPILGGMFVMDWLGVLLSNLVGFLVGTPLKNALVTSSLGIVLMVPWVWFRTGDPAQLLYVVLVNLAYWWAFVPELREYARLRREGRLEEFRDSDYIRVVGRHGDETVDNVTTQWLFRRLLERLGLRGRSG